MTDDNKDLCGMALIDDLQFAHEQQPDDVDILKNLCSELEKAGYYQRAVQAYDCLIRLEPGKPRPVARLALLLYKLGKKKDGIELACRLTREQPTAPLGWLAYGSLLVNERRLNMAEQALKHALSLNPKLARAHLLLGRVYKAVHQSQKAEEAFESAVNIDSELVEAHEELGNHYCSTRHFERAIKHFKVVMKNAPVRSNVRAMYAGSLFAAGHEIEAQQQFRHMIKIDSNDLRARVGLCMTQIPAIYNTTEEIEEARGRYKNELASLARVLRNAQITGKTGLIDALGFMQPFYLPYQGMNDRDLQSEYGRIVHETMSKESLRSGFDLAPKNIPRDDFSAATPINLAIISGHVFRHSVWNAITKGWIASLDRKKYRITIFATSSYRDSETEWAEDNCDRFVQGLDSIKSWGRAIRESSPNIVLFPEVGMDLTTLQLAALRHAPVQCASWGHPETTGLPTIDYFISADLLEPSDGDEHYSEKLVRLPGLGCTPYPKLERPKEVDRDTFSLDAGRPAFLCSQSPYKYLPMYDEILIRIVRRIPRAFFVFFELDYYEGVNNKLISRMKNAFVSAGLDFEYHCRFLKRLSTADYRSLSNCMDVYLDTIRFSGFNTALGALACGLPVVTHEGAYMRGRLAAGLLRYIDVPDTIARTVDEYVNIAQCLIEEPEWRGEICEKIEKHLPQMWVGSTPIEGLSGFLEKAVALS